MSSCMHAKIENSFAVGINPYSIDWDHLYNHITRFGLKNCMDFDFGAFDSSHNRAILNQLMPYINKHFYKNATPFENKMRLYIWQNICQSVHTNGSDVYLWLKGNPSGNSMTTLINCCTGRTGLRLVWDYIWSISDRPDAKAMQSQHNFNKFVAAVVYGDDIVASVDDKVKEVFNNRSVIEHFPRFGFQATPANKVTDPSQIAPTKSIETLTFLKRSFSECEDGIYAPLDRDTIYGMLQWIRSGPDDQLQALENMRNAVRESALHSEEFFDKFRKECTDAALEFFSYTDLQFPQSYENTRNHIRNNAEHRMLGDAF